MERWIYRNQKKISVIAIVIIFAYISYVLFGPKPLPPAFGQISRPNFDYGLDLGSKRVDVNMVSQRESPKTLKVFKLKSPAITQDEAKKIAKLLGLTKLTGTKDLMRWKNGKKELKIDVILFLVEYKNSAVKGGQGGLSQESIIQTAKTFIKKAGISDDNLQVNNQVKYFAVSGPHLENVKSLKKADFVEVSFDRKIAGQFVFEKSPTTTAATIILNKNGQVFKLVYNGLVLGDSTLYPIRSLDEVSGKIAREGVVVNNLGFEGQGSISTQALTKFTVEDYFVGYFRDVSSGFLQPIYVFRGRGSAGLYEDDIIIYVSAMEDEWLR